MSSNRKKRQPLPFSPKSFEPMREHGSPSKASILLQQENIEYIESLMARKQNFCTCLDLYRVSFENDLPQKCLLHNNFITLYCENQCKLLCVNCIYSSSLHKDHRLVPSKNSVPTMVKDNEENVKRFQEELQKLKYTQGEVKKNKRILDDEFKQVMKEVDQEFKSIFKMIEQRQIQVNKRVSDAFIRATDNNQISLKEVTWWKQAIVKTKSSLPKTSNQEQIEVYKHLVLELFMGQTLQTDKLTQIASGQQIRHEFVKDIIELRETIENMLGEGNKYPKKMNMF